MRIRKAGPVQDFAGRRARAMAVGFRGRALWALLAVCCALAGGAIPLSAQMNDSLRAVIQERLERLDRRLGDSTGLLPDTLRDEGQDLTEDSTLLSLLQLDGYGLVEYRSEGASYDPRNRMLMLLATGGNAVLTRDGRELSADSLVFDEATGRLVTFGEVANYKPRDGNDLQADRFIYDLNEQRGTALGADSEVGAMAGTWRVSGDFPSVTADFSYGNHLMFTTCDLEHPHYHFVARRTKLTSGGWMVARNVVLYFGDVPVLWLPFISQSTEQGRRSGLLPIRFSLNDIVRTSDSYSRRVSNIGYYWAINDYADAQVGLDWWSGNYTAITGGLQYRWQRLFQEGRADFRQFWREDGGSELAFDARYSWQMSERSQLRLSARYASSSSFVRQNSFDPREVTQSIDSQGGFNRRFDWGNIALNAVRKHYLSDDRKEMTLPSASVSFSTITLFPAPVNRARFYNNATFSASGSLSRAIRDLPGPTPGEEGFNFGTADTEAWNGGFSASLAAGALSLSQSVNFNRNITVGVPSGFFTPAPLPTMAGVGSVADLQRPAFFPRVAQEASDFQADEVTWSTTINYQRNLVGSTTITPRLSLSGRSIRSDTSSVGSGYTAAPNRVAFGAQLKSDVYGFYANERVRHKVSPTFDYAYTPKTQPTEIQASVFGPRGALPRNEIVIGLNQTIEMRVGDEVEDTASADEPIDRTAGPRRLPQSRKLSVLAWRTSAVTYDFEQASEQGHYTRGFADNLTLKNQLSSDLLRGFTVSVEHKLFDDSGVTATGGSRTFAPFLSSMNLSFSLSNRTPVFGWLGSLVPGRSGAAGADAESAGTEGAAGDGQSPGEQDAPADRAEPLGEAGVEPEDRAGEDPEFEDPSGFEFEDMGEATVVPGARGSGRSAGRSGSQGGRRGNVGDWNASISYSLTRARGIDFGGSQMLQTSLNFNLTEKWSVRARSSYDIEVGTFNDHTISLQRDLHRWEADFSFRQTPTGNWSFVVEVALRDNRDLHFDYEQRAGGAGSGRTRRR